LRLSRLHCKTITSVLGDTSLIRQQSGGINFCLHIDKHETNSLEFRHHFTKRFALPGVLMGMVPSTLGDTNSLGCNTYPATIKGHHCHLEALSHLAQHIAHRNGRIFKKDLTSSRSLYAQLVFELAKSKSGRAFLDKKCNQPFVLQSWIGLSNYQIKI